MGVASLGGLSPAGACGSEDAPPADAAAAAGSVDLAGALYHFAHAQQMLDRLREEAAEQGEPNAQVRFPKVCSATFARCSARRKQTDTNYSFWW